MFLGVGRFLYPHRVVLMFSQLQQAASEWVNILRTLLNSMEQHLIKVLLKKLLSEATLMEILQLFCGKTKQCFQIRQKGHWSLSYH